MPIVGVKSKKQLMKILELQRVLISKSGVPFRQIQQNMKEMTDYKVACGIKMARIKPPSLQRFGGFLLPIFQESNFRSKQSVVQYPRSYTDRKVP